MKHESRRMAFGGMMTAVAVVIMSLGSLIPINTYVCPVLCILLTRPVLERCGTRIAWCYYMASALLSLLLAPDREAALVYGFLGYYPMVRPWFEKLSPVWLRNGGKLVFFTVSGAAVYGVLMLMLGVEAVLGEASVPGAVMLAATVVLWDVMLMMVDRLLGSRLRRKR